VKEDSRRGGEGFGEVFDVADVAVTEGDILGELGGGFTVVVVHIDEYPDAAIAEELGEVAAFDAFSGEVLVVFVAGGFAEVTAGEAFAVGKAGVAEAVAIAFPSVGIGNLRFQGFRDGRDGGVNGGDFSGDRKSQIVFFHEGADAKDETFELGGASNAAGMLSGGAEAGEEDGDEDAEDDDDDEQLKKGESAARGHGGTPAKTTTQE